jgi:hypothetical protein
MKREHLITILGRAEESEKDRKGVVRPSKRRRILPRRLRGFPFITFYDLAQVNIGSADSPIWADHDILKTPSYSVTEDSEGVHYVYETFTNADYQAYTDKLMEIDVSNWHLFYKEMEFELNPFYVFGVPGIHQKAAPCTYPPQMRMKDKNEDALQPIFDTPVDRGGDPPFDGAAAVKSMIEDVGYAWTERGLEYQGLSHIEYYFDEGIREFFKADTDEAGYKVTATYDSSAAAVTDIAISGNIDVFMVPAVGFWAAVGMDPATSGFYGRFNAMFAYQVAPRKNYPAIVDPYIQLDQDILKDAFIDYQKNRAGMVLSQFEGGNVTFDEYPIPPEDWTAIHYSSQMAAAQTLYYPGGTLQTSLNPTTGTNPFSMTDPFLVAVMKIRGAFYYVWKMTGASSESNTGAGYIIEHDDY